MNEEQPSAAAIRWPLDRTYLHAGLTVRGRTMVWGNRTYVMGVINATPDSFSRDGTDGDLECAAALAREFEAEGADIIDIGAASSRPGGDEIDEREELRRLLPALERIRAETSLPISVDTWRARVAEAAIEAGADVINDIHGFRRDPAMAGVAFRRGTPAVLMHNQRGRQFHDVVDDIRGGLDASLRLAREAGVDPGRIIIDPGFGFGWTVAQNLELMRRLPELWDGQLPLLVGVSRKSTLGAVTGVPVEDRLEATAGAVALCVAAGVDIVRVHDVRAMVRVVRIADAIARSSWRETS